MHPLLPETAEGYEITPKSLLPGCSVTVLPDSLHAASLLHYVFPVTSSQHYTLSTDPHLDPRLDRYFRRLLAKCWLFERTSRCVDILTPCIFRHNTQFQSSRFKRDAFSPLAIHGCLLVAAVIVIWQERNGDENALAPELVTSLGQLVRYVISCSSPCTWS